MNVKELIEHLKEHPQDMEVVTDCGRGGFDIVIYPGEGKGIEHEDWIQQVDFPETMDEEDQLKVQNYLVVR